MVDADNVSLDARLDNVVWHCEKAGRILIAKIITDIMKNFKFS